MAESKETVKQSLFSLGVLMFRAVKLHANISDSVIVGFSGGKDSVVTLDLCYKHFKTVYAYFLYDVPDLSFQNQMMDWAETRYGIKILKIPHFTATIHKKYGIYCEANEEVEEKDINDIYDEVRSYFNCEWIAAGERIADSLWRRGMIKSIGTVDEKRKRFYPIAEWNKAQTFNYIKRNKLLYSPETKYLGKSFNMGAVNIHKVKEFYPEDYQKIRIYYPFIDGILEYSKRLNDEK